MKRRTFLTLVGLAVVPTRAIAQGEGAPPFTGSVLRDGSAMSASWSTEVDRPIDDVVKCFRDWRRAPLLMENVTEIEVRRSDDRSADVAFERELLPVLPNLKVVIRMDVIANDAAKKDVAKDAARDAEKPEALGAGRAEVRWTMLEGSAKHMARRYLLTPVASDAGFTRVDATLSIELPFSPPRFLVDRADAAMIGDEVERLRRFVGATRARRP